jgi:hypothetical protein
MAGPITFTPPENPPVAPEVAVDHVSDVVVDVIDPATSATSAISTPPPCQAVWPPDSVLDDYVRLARRYSESEDQIIIGSILPVISRLLARRVCLTFGQPKYPNLYNVVVTKPGLRKSTTIAIAEYFAKQLLPPTALLSGATSEQALFKSYMADPDRLQIEDEGNTVLSNWSNDAAGKIVAKRMLKLYDCRAWRQNYIKQEKEEKGACDQQIDETSTSLLIGTTLNNARFNGLETRDGMRRRVCYYLSERAARQLDWPEPLASVDAYELVRVLSRLLTLEGEMKLSPDAMGLWTTIQTQNRRAIAEIEGLDHASEAHASMMAESPAKILKRAMIFEVARWAVDTRREWREIQPETLELAAEHEEYCVEANRQLDTIGARAETRAVADAILAKIHTMIVNRVHEDGWIRLTRSEITAKFAANPGRSKGEMTPDRLYTVIIPDLIIRHLARLDTKQGKGEVYAFRPDVVILTGGMC